MPRKQKSKVDKKPHLDVRDSEGKWIKGYRPPGAGPRRHPKPPSLWQMRLRILGSFDHVNGYRKLCELAETDFPEYMKIIAKFLPAMAPEDMQPQQIININPTINQTNAINITERIVAEAGDRPVTPRLISEVLRRSLDVKSLAGPTIDVPTNGKNGKTNGKTGG